MKKFPRPLYYTINNIQYNMNPGHVTWGQMSQLYLFDPGLNDIEEGDTEFWQRFIF